MGLLWASVYLSVTREWPCHHFAEYGGRVAGRPGRQMIVGIILLCVNETATYCFEPAHHCHQIYGARLGTSTGAAFQYQSLTHGGRSPTPRSVSLCRPHWPHSDFQQPSCLILPGAETQAEASCRALADSACVDVVQKGLHTQQWGMSQWVRAHIQCTSMGSESKSSARHSTCAEKPSGGGRGQVSPESSLVS